MALTALMLGCRQAVAENEVARRMVLLWGEAGMPGHVFFHNSGHKISVEGLVLPNDSRYLRAVLQISGIAAATAIHQVAMHCHERGRLLIQVGPPAHASSSTGPPAGLHRPPAAVLHTKRIGPPADMERILGNHGHGAQPGPVPSSGAIEREAEAVGVSSP